MAGLFSNDYYPNDKKRMKLCKKYFDKALKLISPFPIFDDEDINYKRKVLVTDEGTSNNKEAILFLDKALENYCEGNKKLTKNKIYQLKAEVLMLLNRFEEAIKIYEIIIYTEKNDAKLIHEAYVLKCSLLIRAKRFEESLRFCDTTLKLFPNDYYIVAFKGKALYKLGRYKESISTCKKALELHDGALNAWCYKILSLEKLGQYKEALACINDFIKREASELVDCEEIRKIIENKMLN